MLILNVKFLGDYKKISDLELRIFLNPDDRGCKGIIFSRCSEVGVTSEILFSKVYKGWVSIINSYNRT